MYVILNIKGEGMPLPPTLFPFLKIKKKCPDFVHCEVKYAIQSIVLKAPKFSIAGLFYLDFLRKCLSKCPDFKKPPLPWTISDCAPAYIWYKQSDFCSLELYWQYCIGMIVLYWYDTWKSDLGSIPSQDQYFLYRVNYLQLMIYF